MTHYTGKKKNGKKVYYKSKCSTVVIPVMAPDASPFIGEVFLYFAPAPSKAFGGYSGSIAISILD